MKPIKIAFDCDKVEGNINPVNIEMISLLIMISQKTSNTRIIVWSNQGKEIAEEVVRKYGIRKYIYACYDKKTCPEQIDICFDMNPVLLADKNIIIKLK